MSSLPIIQENQNPTNFIDIWFIINFSKSWISIFMLWHYSSWRHTIQRQGCFFEEVPFVTDRNIFFLKDIYNVMTPFWNSPIFFSEKTSIVYIQMPIALPTLYNFITWELSTCWIFNIFKVANQL